MNQYIYDFGAISEQTEEKYIHQIVMYHVSQLMQLIINIELYVEVNYMPLNI